MHVDEHWRMEVLLVGKSFAVNGLVRVASIQIFILHLRCLNTRPARAQIRLA